MTKRREFVIGAGAAAAFALTGAREVRAATSEPCFAPVAKPVAWIPPATSPPVVDRLSAFDPRYDWALLQRGYAAMAALPRSDGRSREAQREIHAWFCASCDGAPEIHERWAFFVWHRAFLYFHERILGTLAGDPSLRLPYWDWENPKRRTVPDGYYRGNLYDETRFLKQGQSVERRLGSAAEAWYYDLDLVPSLIALSAPDFVGTATAGGAVENGPHGFVHASAGGYAPYDTTDADPGDLANLDTAARDPVFFAHHANLDRCWASWEHLPGHVNPRDAGFQRLAFSFFDERGTYVTIAASQLGPTTKLLGYAYDTTIAPPAQTVKKIPLRSAPAPGAVRAPQALDARTIAAAKRVTVGLRDLEVRGNGIVDVGVATAGGNLSLGQLFITPHSARAMQMEKNQKVNTQFSVKSSVVSALTRPGSTLTIASASVAPPPAEAQARPQPPIVGAQPGSSGANAPTGGAPPKGHRGHGGPVSPIVPIARTARFASITIGVPSDAP